MRAAFEGFTAPWLSSLSEPGLVDTPEEFIRAIPVTGPSRHRRSWPGGHSNGRFHAMRTTIDPSGRLVIPKRIRDRLGLRGNEQVEITERDGRIEIEPAPTEVELVREGSVLVARPDHPLPPLTDDIVRETLDRIRR